MKSGRHFKHHNFYLMRKGKINQQELLFRGEEAKVSKVSSLVLVKRTNSIKKMFSLRSIVHRGISLPVGDT